MHILIRNLFSIYFLLYLVLPVIALANPSYSDQVEKLISRHIEASGGDVALKQIKTISRYGQISFYSHNTTKNSYCYHTDIVYPIKLCEQIKGNNQILHERGTNGISYWLWNGNQYEFTNDKEVKDYMRDTAERANRDMLWVEQESNNYGAMALPPSWAPGYSQCIQQITGQNSIRKIYCFDHSTGLLDALGSDEEHRLVSD
jgi:hypothetical protein